MIGTGAHFLTAFITAWVLAMELEMKIIRADGDSVAAAVTR